jgi:hypothetical protein
MNIFILNAMNHYNLTDEQTSLSSDASCIICADNALNDGNYVSYIAYCAAYSAAVYYPGSDDDTEYWLNNYFIQTGESRPDYEAELERDNSFREVK